MCSVFLRRIINHAMTSMCGRSRTQDGRGLDQHRDLGRHGYVEAGVAGGMGGSLRRVVGRLYLWEERGCITGIWIAR